MTTRTDTVALAAAATAAPTNPARSDVQLVIIDDPPDTSVSAERT